MKKILFALTAVTGLGACGGVSGLIYTDLTTSRNWISLQRNDNTQAAEAHGEACGSSILGLIATGNAGFDAAYKAALASSGANSLWDVRADTRNTTILGIFSTVCTEVTGKVSK
jgi:hypothetical protein